MGRIDAPKVVKYQQETGPQIWRFASVENNSDKSDRLKAALRKTSIIALTEANCHCVVHKLLTTSSLENIYRHLRTNHHISNDELQPSSQILNQHGSRS